jgi:hypothetical protein
MSRDVRWGSCCSAHTPANSSSSSSSSSTEC